jgi:hypothetical protein
MKVEAEDHMKQLAERETGRVLQVYEVIELLNCFYADSNHTGRILAKWREQPSNYKIG